MCLSKVDTAIQVNKLSLVETKSMASKSACATPCLTFIQNHSGIHKFQIGHRSIHKDAKSGFTHAQNASALPCSSLLAGVSHELPGFSLPLPQH